MDAAWGWRDTHWFRFLGGGGGLQNYPSIFPGGSIAAPAVAAIPGQVLSTNGQSLSVIKIHLTSSAHHFPNSLRSTLSPSVSLDSSLYSLPLSGRNSQQSPYSL